MTRIAEYKRGGGPMRVEEAGLSVVVPAYNEEEGVGSVVKTLFAELETTGWPFEIIAVDDGSIDETAERAEAAGALVVRHPANRSYGAALKTGIRQARHALICIADADGTYPIENIPELVRILVADNCDMVVGRRALNNTAISLVRRPAKWAIGRLAELVAGEQIPDLNSGLRVFKRETALRFFNLLPNGFSFTTTLTLAMLSNAYFLGYTPINYYPRVGRSKIRPIRDTLNFAGLILRMALYFAPLKLFLPLSGILVMVAIGWGLVSKFVFGQLADVSSVIIVVAAIQVAVVGLLAELINRRVPNSYRDDD